MWLRRLVGIVMILTCIGMNALVLVGFFTPTKVSTVGFAGATAAPTIPAPTVTMTAKPDAISANSFSAVSWSTSGTPDSCTASDAWSGPKTSFGAESTGRITTPGNYSYTLTCTGKGGSAKASVVVAVGPAAAPPPAAPKSNRGGSASSPTATSYCGGANPCYGPREIAAHGNSGNCWGWNGDRVINITGLDAGFHKAKSGISTVEISQICGKDLAPSLNGSVSAEGATRNHNPTTKANTDSNEQPYFVGYFDSRKP